MDFFEKTGKMAIGSRLRLLTDCITADAARIYQLYGVDIRPKWFPVFFVLSDGTPKTITGIAREIGHSHPSVSNIVKEMAACGLIEEVGDEQDKRRNTIRLSSRGERMQAALTEQCTDVAAAIESISAQSRHDLWSAIGEWEELLAEKSLIQRVTEAKKARERQEVSIHPYRPEFRSVFKTLNEQWITSHWQLEAHDMEVLDHPDEAILGKGGAIFVATYRGIPAGVCALCKTDDPKYEYELAKLAVASDMQGKGIGRLLCEAVIAKAKALGATRLFLESNTMLKPAIRLYRKLGFTELSEYHPAYARGDIQMELLFESR